MMISRGIVVFAGLVILSTPLSILGEQSDESALIQIRGKHAIGALFGIPTIAARPVQTREFQLSLEHSNQYLGGSTNEEALLLDGETSELTIRHRQRLGACVQLEAVVPFIQHSGGVFDHAIDEWHTVFGLPDAHRGEAESNELTYAYIDATGVGVLINSAQQGIGDIQLSLQRNLGCQATADSTGLEPIARVGLKLPTGSLDTLTGSGEFDFFADIQSPVISRGERWRLGATLGALLVGQADFIDKQNTLVGYGTLGAQYILTPIIRLMGQFDWHTPFYRSDLTELGRVAGSLTAGIRYLAPSDQTIELTLSEDLVVDTSPDVVVRLSWTYRPKGGR